MNMDTDIIQVVKNFFHSGDMGDKIERLTAQADVLEKKAKEAEDEAVQRKRIEVAEKRIQVAKPKKSSFGGLSLKKILIGLVVLVVAILLVAKACG